MMSLSKKNDENSKTLHIKIALHIVCTLALATLTVIGAVYSSDAIDKWFDNIMHQVYTFIACFVILGLFVVYMKWGKK